MRPSRWLSCALAVVGLSGCGSVLSSSAMVPPSGVHLTALQAPAQAEELGTIRVEMETESVQDLIVPLAEKVIQLGGNWAKVESVRCRFTVLQSQQMLPRPCGGAYAPQTCWVPDSQTIQTPTLTLIAKVYRVKGSVR